MWFQQLTGIQEGPGVAVASLFAVEGEWLTSTVNGRCLRHGRLELPSLAELRRRSAAASARSSRSRTTVAEVVADVRRLHVDPANRGSLFQVASQFNLLEMAAPSITPEDGIERYEHDHTQGPACAVSCGAGTIYRNYLVPFDAEDRPASGQRADRQLDTLADLGRSLGNEGGRLWVMRNGYALATGDGLASIASALATADGAVRDELAGQLRIGLQLDTEVTADDAGHVVDQAYCAALPVAYGDPPAAAWEPFARLVLEASYEATLLTAIIRRSPVVFLTLLGGGVFGNDPAWIVDAIARALALPAIADAGLDVRIVSHGGPNPAIAALKPGAPDPN